MILNTVIQSRGSRYSLSRALPNGVRIESMRALLLSLAAGLLHEQDASAASEVLRRRSKIDGSRSESVMLKRLCIVEPLHLGSLPITITRNE